MILILWFKTAEFISERQQLFQMERILVKLVPGIILKLVSDQTISAP